MAYVGRRSLYSLCYDESNRRCRVYHCRTDHRHHSKVSIQQAEYRSCVQWSRGNSLHAHLVERNLVALLRLNPGCRISVSQQLSKSARYLECYTQCHDRSSRRVVYLALILLALVCHRPNKTCSQVEGALWNFAKSRKKVQVA